MNGILIIDKPQGMSSHDVVNKVRNIYHMKHVGHAGTLDPLATGVLVVGIGDALKGFEYLTNDDKIYEFGVIFGKATTTYDLEGDVTFESDCLITNEMIDIVIHHFLGAQEQMPPLYSAIKKDGKPLYQYAINQEAVEVAKRPITIFELKRTSDVKKEGKYCYCQFLAHVSKGTYIRSLAYDLGKALNVPSSVYSLRRIKSGAFNINDAYQLADIKETTKPLNLLNYLPFPKVAVKEDTLFRKINNGMTLKENGLINEPGIFVFSYHDEILAIYEYLIDTKIYKPLKVWVH